MMKSVSFTYALRSLFRHTRRTALSVLGIGIGCSMGILSASWMGGNTEMQIRAISESGGGHLKIVPTAWPETRQNTLRLQDPKEALQAARDLPDTRSVSVRASINAFLAFGNRSAGVEIMGVQPKEEKQCNRLLFRGEMQGRYLDSEDQGCVVIGQELSERLDVTLGDELYVTVAGKDEIRSAMLRIVGLLSVGSRDLESTFCHTTLQELERMTGYEDAGEISILLKDHKDIPKASAALRRSLKGENEVITWKEVNPGLAANVEGDTAFMRGMVSMIILIVSFGIASAQITAVLERKREFAVLTALGLKGRQLMSLILLEAFFVGLGGGLVASLLGGSAAHLLSTRGVDFSAMMGDEMGFADVLLDPHIYGAFGAWILLYAFGVSVLASLLASLYPAWLTTKINPTNALRTVQP